MTKRLANKIAIVTGATSGIGLSTAAFRSRRSPGLHYGSPQGRSGRGRRSDRPRRRRHTGGLGKERRTRRRLRPVKSQQGRLDVTVVNAGGGSMLPLGEITEEQVDNTFARNVKAVIFTVQRLCH